MLRERWGLTVILVQVEKEVTIEGKVKRALVSSFWVFDVEGTMRGKRRQDICIYADQVRETGMGEKDMARVGAKMKTFIRFSLD